MLGVPSVVIQKTMDNAYTRQTERSTCNTAIKACEIAVCTLSQDTEICKYSGLANFSCRRTQKSVSTQDSPNFLAVVEIVRLFFIWIWAWFQPYLRPIPQEVIDAIDLERLHLKGLAVAIGRRGRVQLGMMVDLTKGGLVSSASCIRHTMGIFDLRLSIHNSLSNLY